MSVRLVERPSRYTSFLGIEETKTVCTVTVLNAIGLRITKAIKRKRRGVLEKMHDNVLKIRTHNYLRK